MTVVPVVFPERAANLNLPGIAGVGWRDDDSDRFAARRFDRLPRALASLP
ncbi:MAG TPA: hypothetical protein VGC97_01730 [Pyrinomonadaceae bacterium]